MHRESVFLKEEQTWHLLTNYKNESFEFVYLNKIIRIRDLKIAEFNFKLLHQILPCKKFLCKIGVIPDNRCAWCDKGKVLNICFSHVPQLEIFGILSLKCKKLS